MWGKLPEASYRNQPCSPPCYQHLAIQTKYTEFFGRLEGERRKIPISGMESEEPDPLGGLGKPHGAPLFMSRFLNTSANLLLSTCELLLSSLCLPKAGGRASAESSWLCGDGTDPRNGRCLLQQHVPGWHGFATGLSTAAGTSSGVGKQCVSCLGWAEFFNALSEPNVLQDCFGMSCAAISAAVLLVWSYWSLGCACPGPGGAAEDGLACSAVQKLQTCKSLVFI